MLSFSPPSPRRTGVPCASSTTDTRHGYRFVSVADVWSRDRSFRDETTPAMVVAAEEAVLLGVEHGDLAVALGTLSPELRAVVQATVLDGLTTREAARLLKIPTGTVKTRMMRARTQLRGALA